MGSNSTNSPPSARDVETIYTHPEKVRSLHADVDGYRTHYLEAGEPGNVPLVLIHGGNFQIGLASDRWFPNIIPLARRFRVFAIDELGGGDTDPPRNIADLGHIRVRAEHVLAFIEGLKLGPVHLVGQSQGSWIAAHIALKRPDLVRGLVLVDTASLALPAGGMNQKNIAARFTESFAPGTMVNESLRPTKESVREYVSLMLYESTVLPEPFLENLTVLAKKWLPIWDKPWREFWADGGERNREQYLFNGTHISEHVHKLKPSPLIVWGKNTVKGLDTGIELFKKIPHAELHIFDEANHFLWIDQPRKFNRLVESFLGDQS